MTRLKVAHCTSDPVLNVKVQLASGAIVSEGIRMQPCDMVEALQLKIKEVASCQHFRLISAHGQVLRAGTRLIDNNISGDVMLTMVLVRSICIWSTGSAFVAMKADGSVVTWGDAENGGDSSAVQGQLADVQQVCSTICAVAAVKADGSVVTWGEARSGGDSFAVREQLFDVRQVYSTTSAFAAVKVDGSVVTWDLG
eukprot:TRINITY_DN8168_c0_g1_i10.p2 TRINITY_DN8168_c0_g1~~TRINITY_DN8168_c0_g1_i10.p2  ORF type:complete len:205 (+),score=32.91 TRINITY_DN8168_c0_g1_i10:27-617(+)